MCVCGIAAITMHTTKETEILQILYCVPIKP